MATPHKVAPSEKDNRSGWIDCVRIDSRTEGRISAFIDRLVTVDYRIPHKVAASTVADAA